MKKIFMPKSVSSIQHTYEADLVVMKKPKSLRLHVSKNRYGEPGDKSYSEVIDLILYKKTIKETIDVLAEVIARKKFGGITKIFEEGMKIQLKKEITKIVME
jgi:hypothetical protein